MWHLIVNNVAFLSQVYRIMTVFSLPEAAQQDTELSLASTRSLYGEEISALW
jgi:hypothetical protein